MNAQEFVASWRDERDRYLVSLFAGSSGLAGKQLKEMGLSDSQIAQMWLLLDTITSDVMYTLLLGLDGSAAIGNSEQQTFKVHDEDGNLLSAGGDLEVEAYESFHAKSTDISALQERSLALLRDSRKDWNLHEVLAIQIGGDGIVRCPHCGKSFHISSARSWDGEKHLSCGMHLQLIVPSSGA